MPRRCVFLIIVANSFAAFLQIWPQLAEHLAASRFGGKRTLQLLPAYVQRGIVLGVTNTPELSLSLRVTISYTAALTTSTTSHAHRVAVQGRSCTARSRLTIDKGL